MKNILWLLILLTSCHPKEATINDDPLLALIHQSADIQEERQKLQLLASNSLTGREIKKVALHYISRRKAQIPEVRKIFVQCAEYMLSRINSDEKLKPYLKKGQLNIDQLDLSISFAADSGDFFEPPYIAYVYLFDQKIHYCYYDNFFGQFTTEEDVTEPYQDALEWVNNNN